MYNDIPKSRKNSDNDLGFLIRQCRKSAMMTMQTLADKTGLSVGYISQVERNITVPTLTSLKAIAGVLNQRVSYFFEHPYSDEETTRFRERLVYQIGEKGASYERLSTRFHGSMLQSVIMYLPSGFRSETTTHEGEEFIFMLEGEMTFEFADKTLVIKRGDSIHFDAQKRHTAWNHTAELTVLLWCGTMVVFDENSD